MRVLALAEGLAPLLWFSVFWTCTLSLGEVFQIEDHCITACPFQQVNRTDIGDFDYGCNHACKIEQCGEGCRLWRLSLKSSCRDVCNGTEDPLPPSILHCVIGCNSAITHYLTQLRDRIHIPPAPALVPDSLTATSLRLKWHFPEAGVAAADGLSYLVQWRYEELADTWQYCRNQTWNASEDTVLVDELMPYTKYRFRVALLLSSYKSKLHHSELIVSEPSVVILTQAAGHPASAPVIVRAVPVDSNRISVSWEPGPFPHGPLLTYVLVITNVNHNTSIIKEIPADQQYYTFRNLKASENYTISLQMINEVGAGPASHIIVSTPMEPTVKDNEKLVLILRTEHKVFEQGIEISDEPKELYSTEEKIEGVALHVGQQLLFLSDSSGSIYRLPLNATSTQFPTTDAQSILTPAQTTYAAPSLLSVDWLNGQLYVLGEVRTNSNKVKRWQVIRCALDGSGMAVVVAGLVARPQWMEVDPYNGFLFWVINKGTKSGLYRLDLANISNGIKHDLHPEHILAENNLGAFTIDHNNFRLLVSYQNNSTVYSVSLDGKEVYNIRKKVATSRMEKITSLAYNNKKFYWTNDSRLFYEEYHQYTDSYYQNSYPDFNNVYKTVLVNLESAQPIPIPVNPPRAVQAIFGVDKAKISWQVPHLLGGQGKGAWQNWSYELSIKDVFTGHVDTTHRNITSTSYTLYHLLPNRQYVIKASAYTDHGTGPWSSEFSGRTLKENKQDVQKSPVLFWATNKGLLKSDATGDDVVTLLDTTATSDASNMSFWKGSYFTDMAWFQNQLYLVSNGSKVLWYNTTTRTSGEIHGIGSVGSIVIDWIGKKLYWSNPQKQLISRGNLDGSQQEPLPIITLAKELNIDSINAYLYWSSGYSVECAHLNGANKIDYHPGELFEKQVMGVTLDTDHHYVYWIVRGSDGSHLYRAPMMGTTRHAHFTRSHVGFSTDRLRYNLPRSSSTMRGPLRYFHGRLVWLGDDRRAVIGDLHENKTAVVASETLSGLNMFYIMDEEVYKLPNTTKIAIEDICVIPEPVDNKSIKIQGSWQSFNVTWNSVKRVNYGTVFYEIKIDTDLITNDTAVITTSPSFPYPRTIPPFTPLHITIRPYTYYSPQPYPIHSVPLRSPESTPDTPLHLRAYITHLHMRSLLLAEDIRVTFRWRPPGRPNGLIRGYRVRCWFKEHDGDRMELCEGVVATDLEYVLRGLLENETYYFQVQAFTTIGDGELSPVLGISTASQYPVPTLILTGRDSIYRLDVDNNRTETILSNIPTPIELAYLLTENRLFWINDANELYMYNTETLNKTKILNEEDYLNTVTIDWLERAIYYVKRDIDNSTICKVDLNRLDKGILKRDNVVIRPGRINKIEVSPFTQKLLWTELDQNDTVTLQTSYINGTNITQLFIKRKDHKRDVMMPKCDCPLNIGETISKSFTLDHSQDKNNPSLIIIDTLKNEVLASDTEGCNCKIISTKVTNHNINDIKIDQVYIYWTSKMNLYVVNRNTGELTIKERLHATDVSIFGTHIQPYPNTECLMPKVDQNINTTLISTTSKSVTLSMPSYKPNDDCQHVTIAEIEYHIYYRPYDTNSSLKRINSEDSIRCNENCTEQMSFEKNVTITDLLPYSRYIFSVSIANYFTDIAKRKIVIGPGVAYKTAVGAPSHARNVSAIPLTPNLISVCWSTPLHPNGDRVHYEVYWETDGRATTGIRQKGDLIYSDDSQLLRTNDDVQTVADCEHSVLLRDLAPHEMYTIGVRSFSSRNQSLSGSGDRIQLKTFPQPDNITVVDIKPYELVLQWNISKDAVAYNIQFALITSTTWTNISSALINKDRSKDKVTVSIPTLTAKTIYKFRLLLRYPLYKKFYYWPKDQRFTFETLGDKPSTPGTPIIQHINEVYQVSWEPSKPNGAHIEEYLLEMMKIRNYRVKRSTNRTAYSYFAPSIEETDFEWEFAHNGTDAFWKIEDLDQKYKYVFRVKARNSYGWSNSSVESLEFDWSSATQLAEKQDFTIIIIAVFVMIVLIFMALFCGLVACNCCKANKKSQQIIVTTRGPDVELATLRELPRRSNFIHNTNILYISTQISPEQITLLPHIRRDQITLTKFLGSGAFGEVFEGTAKGCANMHGTAETKVAVKTLRKGASDQEKTEFLQEAQLMSHFKHEHILQLLGVCLDNDPHFIIMELMQGGDLLTYLRLSRKSNTNSLCLTLLDLVRMCLDVAKGCRYLEEMHFVHRDLACRNCLVSSTDPDNRIVKIGDFGLARDIYKNDYYRKEGEGLLPVRWMAPESLVDGVFTCQSDVWAFGVLLWEIMTLGQQPYPARNNLEVLHYVRRGGRLGKPVDCPEDLHALMLICWNYEAEQRPTFKHCLEILERLYLDLLSNPVTGVHNGQYISTVPLHYGVFNQAYFQDENHNNSGNSWKSGSESDISRERTPFLSTDELPSGEIPKYLELLYDGEPPVENDGYEVPRSVPFINSDDQATVDTPVTPPIVNSDKSVVEICNTNVVDNDDLLKEAVNINVSTNVGYTNMTPERNIIINSETNSS